MRLLVRASVPIAACCLALAVGCSAPFQTTSLSQDSAQSAAAVHVNVAGSPLTNPHVIFLPPVGTAPASFDGTFDPTLSPTFVITRDGHEVVTFRSNGGPAARRVRRNGGEQQYIANWLLRNSDRRDDATYRIHVLVHNVEIASHDVRARWRTIPIRVRIEKGAYVPVAGVAIEKSGDAQLTAVISPVDATVQSVTWTSSNPSAVTLTPDPDDSRIVTVDPHELGSAMITVESCDGGFTATAQAANRQQIEQWGASTATLPSGGRFVAVSIGHRGSTATEYGLAVTDGGHLYGWGADQYGTVSGIPGGVTAQNGVFESVRSDVADVSAGGTFAAAVTTAGQLLEWGQSPAIAPTGVTVTSVSVGDAHALAVTNSGNVVAWGSDANGQCSLIPGGATDSGGVFTSVESDFVSVAAGSGWSIAVRSDGTLAFWGSGTAPQKAGFSSVSTAVSGSNLAVGIRGTTPGTAGTLFSWYVTGGAVLFSPPGSDYLSASAGVNPAIALTTDGHIVTWGSDGNGECSAIPGGATSQAGYYESVSGTFVAAAAGYATSYAIERVLELTVP